MQEDTNAEVHATPGSDLLWSETTELKDAQHSSKVPEHVTQNFGATLIATKACHPELFLGNTEEAEESV